MEKNNILNQISFAGKSYEELTNPGERREVEAIAFKLKPLKEEILNDPKGIVSIMTDGHIVVLSFDTDLAGKINNLLH